MRPRFWEAIAGLFMLAIVIAVVVASAFALSGCAVVTVQSDGGRPRISAWPLGVRIDRGGSDAMAVQYGVLGAGGGCGAAGLGVVTGWCVVIDPRTCGVAVVEIDTPVPAVYPPDLRRLAQASDEVRAQCLTARKDPP